jgi:hypothetical protein
VEDVCRVEALFVEEVTKRHPDAPGKPVIIGNCQAGWQIMMMAAIRPELAGPIMLAGSPLSYWAGVRGKNPMRYTGGMLGGTWLTALAGDLGDGKFDGANLVANFEQMNPANTYWQKPYNVYSKIDTETHRFLDFETWWGSPVLLNATEMQWIADNLFVGNKLATGELRTSDGLRIDLRNIRSPIIVFCSWGDNITPPQQALGWVIDMYAHENEIVANGQTIIYALHQSIGHLGIFVSGKVASKEHDELTLAMDLIEMMPPGLYEAVITEPDEGVRHPELIEGKYLFRLERRTLADIRALGANTPEDDQRFATVARLSEINRGLYETLAGPAVRAMVSEPAAELMRRMHPNRLRFALFSDENPLMQPVKAMAESVRQARQSASLGNPFVGVEHAISSWIATCWETWGNTRDTMMEAAFLATYGSPLVQALVGLGPHVATADRRMGHDVLREAQISEGHRKLERRFEVGGPLEAGIRALIYIRIPEGSVDERGFAMLKTMRAAQPQAKQLPMAMLKEVFKEQFLLVSLDEARALQTLPSLLPKNAEERKKALEAVHRMLGARDPLGEEPKRRLAQVEQLFDGGAEKPADRKLAHA